MRGSEGAANYIYTTFRRKFLHLLSKVILSNTTNITSCLWSLKQPLHQVQGTEIMLQLHMKRLSRQEEVIGMCTAFHFKRQRNLVSNLKVAPKQGGLSLTEAHQHNFEEHNSMTKKLV